jgi:hypothetical protein
MNILGDIRPIGAAGHYELGGLGVRAPALPPAWLRYRDAYAVLQHLSSLAGGEEGIGVSWSRLMAELGFSAVQADELLGYLVTMKCARYRQGRREVALTASGVEYLRFNRGRRRSVRPVAA